MSFSEDIGVTGRVVIEARDPEGRLVEARQVKNLVTLKGRELLGRCLAGVTGLTGQLYMAVGKGESAPMLKNEALDEELDSVIVNQSTVGFEDDRVVLRVTATFPRLTGNVEQKLSEAGIVIKPPSGPAVLFNRVKFPVVTRSSALEISLTWEVLF